MNQKQPKSLLFWILLAVPVGFVSLCCLGSCIATLVGVPVKDELERKPSNTKVEVAARSSTTAAEPTTATAVAAPAPEAPPFEEIRNNMREMTDAQWNKYAASLAGNHVTWTGWVDDVNEKVFGGYEVWIDMDPPDAPLSVQDVFADVSEELAVKLKKGQQVSVSGTIASATNVLGSLGIKLEKDAVVKP